MEERRRNEISAERTKEREQEINKNRKKTTKYQWRTNENKRVGRGDMEQQCDDVEAHTYAIQSAILCKDV